MPNFNVSVEDREILIMLVGVDTWLLKPSQVRRGHVLDPDGFPRSGTTMGPDGVVIFMADDNLATLCHEYGHGVHATKYPDSVNWSDAKSEGFAYLSDMRAMKMKKALTSEQRIHFADHIRRSRNEGYPQHKAGMKLAFKAIFGHSKRKDQEKYIVES